MSNECFLAIWLTQYKLLTKECLIKKCVRPVTRSAFTERWTRTCAANKPQTHNKHFQETPTRKEFFNKYQGISQWRNYPIHIDMVSCYLSKYGNIPDNIKDQFHFSLAVWVHTKYRVKLWLTPNEPYRPWSPLNECIQDLPATVKKAVTLISWSNQHGNDFLTSNITRSFRIMSGLFVLQGPYEQLVRQSHGPSVWVPIRTTAIMTCIQIIFKILCCSYRLVSSQDYCHTSGEEIRHFIKRSQYQHATKIVVCVTAEIYDQKTVLICSL